MPLATEEVQYDEQPLDFDIGPIVASIEDILKKQLTNNISSIQKQYQTYIEAYKSIKSLPFIIELTQANERLQQELKQSHDRTKDIINHKVKLELQIHRLESQMTRVNSLVTTLVDRLMNLEPNNIYLEIKHAANPCAKSSDEMMTLIDKLYADLGIADEDEEENDSDNEELALHSPEHTIDLGLCSQDLKKMLRSFDSLQGIAVDDSEFEEADAGDEAEDEIDTIENTSDDIHRIIFINKTDEPSTSTNYTNQKKEEAVEEEEVEEKEEEEVEEEEVEEEEVEEEEVEEEAVEEEAVEEEAVEEEEVEEDINEEIGEETDDDEVFEVTIGGNKYFATNLTNGIIYEYVDDDTMGKELGVYKNSEAIFN